MCSAHRSKRSCWWYLQGGSGPAKPRAGQLTLFYGAVFFLLCIYNIFYYIYIYILDYILYFIIYVYIYISYYILIYIIIIIYYILYIHIIYIHYIIYIILSLYIIYIIFYILYYIISIAKSTDIALEFAMWHSMLQLRGIFCNPKSLCCLRTVLIA